MPVELSEKELDDLRAKADAADKAAEREAALVKKQQETDAALAMARKKYDDDMRQVATYLQNQNQNQSTPVETSAAEDPDAIVSRKDLLRASQETARYAAEASAQQAAVVLRNQRAINKQLAAARLGPKAEKYMAEIDAHLDKLDPTVAAQPTAYDEVFKYVRSAHFDEELEEAAKLRETQDIDGQDNEPYISPSTSRPISRSEPAAPLSSVTSPRPIARQQAAKVRLNDEQRRVAAGFGMTDEEYSVQYATDTVMTDNDFMGFKNRTRV